MAIKVQCPGCNKVLSAQDSYHYKMMKCPNCGTKFRVTIPADLIPTPSDETPVLQLEPLEKERPEKAKQQQQCPICGELVTPIDFELGLAVRKENEAYHASCLQRQESAARAAAIAQGEIHLKRRSGMSERKPNLEIWDEDPYCIWNPDTGEIVARVYVDPDFPTEDPYSLFLARLFAASHKLFVELETIVLSKKKGILQYWDDKKAKKILKEIGVAVGREMAKPRGSSGGRETIPKGVQREVWRRDKGRCVECGSKDNLEFDHIIPVSRGGSNTARNIQLLCEHCNRKKSGKEPGHY